MLQPASKTSKREREDIDLIYLRFTGYQPSPLTSHHPLLFNVFTVLNLKLNFPKCKATRFSWSDSESQTPQQYDSVYGGRRGPHASLLLAPPHHPSRWPPAHSCHSAQIPVMSSSPSSMPPCSAATLTRSLLTPATLHRGR